jgi:hypothetical protein
MTAPRRRWGTGRTGPASRLVMRPRDARRSYPLNPAFRCEPSQNGLFSD